jgi:hypothetical protein
MVIKSNFIIPQIYFKEIEEEFWDLPISIFMDYKPEDEELEISPINFMILHEPNEFFRIHDFAYDNFKKFNGILTYNKTLLEVIPNAISFSWGLIQSQDKKYYNSFKNKEKEFEVSFLSGVKTMSNGHQLRQLVYGLKDQITIPTKWYKVLEDFDHEQNVRPGYTNYSKNTTHIPDFEAPEQFGKRVLFDESMFNIAIENVQNPNWYTEKIAQAFATKTVPIYWGCPNLDELGYDSRGVITFTNPKELLDILNNLTPEDYYDRLEYINHNYNVSLTDTFKNNIHSFIDNFKKINKL